MRSTRGRVGIVVASAAAVTLGLGAITGAATSFAFADPTPSPSASSSAAPKTDKPRTDKQDRAGKRHRRLGVVAGRALHGEAVLKGKDGKYITVYEQRGTVTAVDSDSIAVKSEDGFSKTYAVDKNTKVAKDRQKSAITDIKINDNVVVIAVKDGNKALAKTIAEPKK